MEQLKLILIDGPNLINCEFKTKEPVECDTPSIECGYSLEIFTDLEQKSAKILISAISNSESVPFSFDVKSQCVFQLDNCPQEITNKEKFDKEAFNKAWPYMFTFLKEVIADLTRKANLPTFNLPPIDLEPLKVEE